METWNMTKEKSRSAVALGKRGAEARWGGALSLPETQRIVRSALRRSWKQDQIAAIVNRSQSQVSKYLRGEARGTIALRGLIGKLPPEECP
jgi:hypothetical protein